ncbi:hypothetical protein ACFVFF_23025 [Streptomyces sp. NPDC057680]|uniref:hypothetical protein n=1 Tax=Streptomyces sp. NPDC057680 TaxID=3346208 RepID=UPI0036B3DAB7
MSARQDPTRREELLFMLRHGGAFDDEIANRVVDNAIAEALAKQAAVDDAELGRQQEDLHRRIQHEKDGKARWRKRAEEAEDRVVELERAPQRPSRFSATPAQVDEYLRRILAEDTLLNYQRAIGNKAVEEAAMDIRMEIATLRVNGVLEPGKDWAASSVADHIDPAKGGGHYPSKLLCSRHNGFGRCPGAPWCTPNESQAVPQQRGESR